MKLEPTFDLSWGFAEMQAEYGPYQFPELALQRIWRDAHFDAARLATADGRSVRVLSPGNWNRLGGPDFHGAQLRFGEELLVGDVEVHVHADDWYAHGHERDSAYADVVLHVVLFPVPAGSFTRGFGGRAIPIVALLDLIPEDLESHAAAFALEAAGWRQTGVPPNLIAVLDSPDREAQIRGAALVRWERKVADAKKRIARLGWSAACHAAALEVLGYSRNRVAMLRVAEEWPLERWRAQCPRIQDMVAAQVGRWGRQGYRPANAPAVRLAQYARWIEGDPEWPAWLAEAEVPPLVVEADDWWTLGPAGRRFREWFRDDLCAGSIGGRRFDTLVCDAFLPLLAARDRSQLELAWVAWPAGDIPDRVASLLAHGALRLRPRQRVANGWVQGIWGFCLETPKPSGGTLGGS